MESTPQANGSRPHAITQLLARYMNGEIRDTAWNRFMALMDSNLFSLEDRAALANFFKDALDEFGGQDDIYIPMLAEASSVFEDGHRFAA